jgi:exodeoxyribonuclease VII large subunit
MRPVSYSTLSYLKKNRNLTIRGIIAFETWFGLVYNPDHGRGILMNWVKVVINGREVSVGFDENSIHVYNAFPIKDDLKLRGYRWNPGDKSWFIAPRDVDEEMAILKNNLQPVSQPLTKPLKGDISPFPPSCSVVELRNRIDLLIKEGIRGQLWIRGVIASQVKHYQWASYFDLKDEDEQRDVFFRVEIKKSILEKINQKLKESGVAEELEIDLPVFFQVEVHLSLRNVVDVRLTVFDVLPEYTQAKIRNLRDITLEKLKTEGILDKQKQLTLPVLISRVGIITSEQGTSVQDIMAGLGNYKNRYQFYFLDTRMEGTMATGDIIESLDLLEKRKDLKLDAVVIARGGGSEQSLAVFNDYRLCQRVCQAGIPVLTAIGHEKDISAVEICSFFTPTPSTPSGMGKFLQDRYVNLQIQLSEAINILIHFFQDIRNREIEKISAALKNIPSRILQFIKFKNRHFISLVRQFYQSVGFLVREQKRKIDNLILNLALAREKIIKHHGLVIQKTVDAFFSRTGSAIKRENRLIEKTITRLDFEKQRLQNQKNKKEIFKSTEQILRMVSRFISFQEKELLAHRDLVRASDPEHILKKGFTLTLDEKKQVLQSLKQFKKVKSAWLKFQDGVTAISQKEDK